MFFRFSPKLKSSLEILFSLILPKKPRKLWLVSVTLIAKECWQTPRPWRTHVKILLDLWRDTLRKERTKVTLTSKRDNWSWRNSMLWSTMTSGSIICFLSESTYKPELSLTIYAFDSCSEVKFWSTILVAGNNVNFLRTLQYMCSGCA